MAIIFIWVPVSIWVLLWKRVFSDGPLLARPRSANFLRIWNVLAVILMVRLVGLLSRTFTFHSSHISRAALHPSFWLADAAWRVIAVAMVLIFARLTFVGGIRGMGLKSGAAIGQGVLIGIGTIAVTWPLVYLGEVLSYMVQHDLWHQKVPQNAVLQAVQTHPSSAVLVLMTLSLCVLAPISEELFFRGFVQSYLAQLFANLRRHLTATPATAAPSGTPLRPEPAAIQPSDRWGAIFISSAFFALVHAEPSAFVALFLLAIALGYVYERTGNLWANITMHAVFNATSLTAILLLPVHH